MAGQSIRVGMYGLGAIGADIARLIQQQPHLELVCGIEADPAKAGHDLGELIGAQPLGFVVETDAARALRHSRPDVVVVATTSLLRSVFGQIRDCLAVGARVVSTCEELIYPMAADPVIADQIDREARGAGAAVLGIGTNPGFVMDLLPILLTAPSIDIRHIFVQRVVDASTRRATLQQRIGAGLDPLMFRSWLQQRSTPHIGLTLSMRMVADALGWQLDRVTENVEPLLAETWLRTAYVTVAPGQVAGIHQSARGYRDGHELIQLDWRTAIGMEDTHDAIKIVGTPPIDLVIRGGIHGDQATAALVTRAIPAIMAAQPGLRTVLDLPVLHYSKTRYAAPARLGR